MAIRNKIIVFIIVVLIVLGIGFGGKSYMNKEEEEDKVIGTYRKNSSRCNKNI